MEKHFIAIKQQYDDFYRSLLRQGRLPQMETAVGHWGISVSEEVFELFKQINLKHSTHFLDLGHGDGKVTLIASLFTNASGIEYDPWLHSQSRVIQQKLSHIENVKNARLLKGNYNDFDFRHYDTFFSHPDKKMEAKLLFKLLNEAKGSKLFVHGNVYLPDQLEAHSTHEINGTVYHEFRL